MSDTLSLELFATPYDELRARTRLGPADSLSKKQISNAVAAFSESTAAGLLHLSTDLYDATLAPAPKALREFSHDCLTSLCRLAAQGKKPVSADKFILQQTIERLPPLHGGEYLTTELFDQWWHELAAYIEKQSKVDGVMAYLEQRSPKWRAVGRVTFHLAENKNNPDYPFAFMATLIQPAHTGKTEHHVPLSHALQAGAESGDTDLLLAMLTPVQRAADELPWLEALIDDGSLYQALAWSPAQAHEFLQSVDQLNKFGLSVRAPDWWYSSKERKPTVEVKVGSKKHSHAGLNALIDFDVNVVFDGKKISQTELDEILNTTTATDNGLVRLRGRWVELDRDRLTEVLDHWTTAKEQAHEGVSFAEAMRWLSGIGEQGKQADNLTNDQKWLGIEAGPWLKKTLDQLGDPAHIKSVRTVGLKATLRDYQSVGVNWLHFMAKLRLGACLADDMGLGKTIQVLGLLLRLKSDQKKAIAASSKTGANSPRHSPALASLLVAPASLLGNWRSEIDKFSPSLNTIILHPSEPTIDLKDNKGLAAAITENDLVITSYTMLARIEAIQKINWQVVILDEAQAIKNSSTKHTRAVKTLKAQSRVALTGTPVENQLGDLWSLFDFLNPGLLGNATEFKRFIKRLENNNDGSYAPLRRLINPYFLRRLKTDKNVISDLPDKTELQTWCGLSKQQAKLYQASVRELRDSIEEAEGIERRGLVLAYLTRFKQICNHPAHWSGVGEYTLAASGKFQRLVALCEEMAERQEKVLVFTQYRQLTQPLANVLADVFESPGLVLHGSTAVKKRQDMVKQFQQDDGPPFFILSLKAGGTGLNLTAATHVIHFDRWWNPAVENQATDRAFRIGQKRNVMVHKFVCRGTIEERIDQMIAEKNALADSVLNTDGAKLLTEMDNDELLDFVSLDVNSAVMT